MLYKLIYVSSAAGLYDAEHYRKIANAAKDYNKSMGISGLLLLYNETIFQLLEGPKEAIENLYAKIEKDTRHKNPLCLTFEPIKAREFKNWAMGFEALEDENESEFLFKLKAATLDRKIPDYICEKTELLISTFKQSSGLDRLY